MEKDEASHGVPRKSIQPQDVIRQAFYPLTLPLTVGPGSISVAITLGANAAHVGSYFVGTYILAFFGISLAVVQVGGGMVLVVMGWATLRAAGNC